MFLCSLLDEISGLGAVNQWHGLKEKRFHLFVSKGHTRHVCANPDNGQD
jgi:hypothetical protein